MALSDRVQAILLRPRETWPVIEAEQTTAGDLYRGYIMPLAAIGPVANVIGSVVFGVSVPFAGGVARASLGNAIATGVISWVLTLLGVWLLAWVIDRLAPNFSGAKDRLKALKVAAYSGTASSVAGVFQVIPALSFLSILGLYSLYLLYLGLPVLMKTPAERAVMYTIAVIVAVIVIGVAIFAVLGLLAGVALFAF